MKILVRYHGDVPPLEKLPQGDWIDLRAAETVEMQAGEYRLISLGVSMKLPAGYEAHVAPRSRRRGCSSVMGQSLLTLVL